MCLHFINKMRFSTAAAACYKNVFSAGHPEKCNYGFCVQITIIHKSPYYKARTILCTFPLASVNSVTLILSYIRDIFSLISERLAACTSISETIYPSFIRRILSQYSSASSGLCIHMRAHLLSDIIFRICFISI